MIRKIKTLSEVFIKEYIQNLNIFNTENKKTNKNKKSAFFLLVIITIISVSYVSYQIIKLLANKGQEELFLKIYFPIISSILIFQAIIICSNIFFFSKDLKYILPLPIKPTELLIAKFNNVICITYGMELLFLGLPLLIYGIVATSSLIYFITMLIVLLIFPISLIATVSIIMLIIMQLIKFIKNKDIFQIVLVLILSFITTSVETYLIDKIFNDNIINIQVNEENQVENAEANIQILHNKLDELNKYFITINSSISLLTNLNTINIILQLIKIILTSTILFFIFIFLGKILYLKSILRNIEYIKKKKINKKTKKNKYKKNKIKYAYIKNEFRKIIKNPAFFIQGIFQYIFIASILLIFVNLFMPSIVDNFKKENIIAEMGINNFVLQCMFTIVGIIQIIFTLGNLSITAISREGKDALVMKYIPVSLYKQFVWKNIPQILINIIVIAGFIIILAVNVLGISIWYYIAGILITIILNIINCFLMLIVDLRKPNLDWMGETSALRDNGKRLYQYVTTIIIILLFMYLSNIFKDINIIISLSSCILIFFTILIILNYLIKKNINKLFDKIN